jgi:hypothetical protein
MANVGKHALRSRISRKYHANYRNGEDKNTVIRFLVEAPATVTNGEKVRHFVPFQLETVDNVRTLAVISESGLIRIATVGHSGKLLDVQARLSAVVFRYARAAAEVLANVVAPADDRVPLSLRPYGGEVYAAAVYEEDAEDKAQAAIANLEYALGF